MSAPPVQRFGHAKLSPMQVFRRGVGGVPPCPPIPPAQPFVRTGVRTARAVSASHSFHSAFRRILFCRYSFFGGSGTEANESAKADFVHRDAGVSHPTREIHRPRFAGPTVASGSSIP